MTQYTWNTKKTKDGFKYIVRKITPLKEKNKQGMFADSKIVKTGIRPTRAKEATTGKKWKMFLQYK